MFAFKKSVLILIFLAISLIVSGTTYYISFAGNDAANGLSESTSWKSILKINSFKFAPGDNVYFKRGDIWYETLVPSASGNSAARITFGAYGTGANPVISGFATLTGWTDVGGGVYSKAVSWQSNPNVLIFDGVNQPLGRYPHLTSISGWPSSIPTASSATSTSLTSSSMPNSSVSNLANSGAEIVMRTAGATNDRCTITGHSGTTVSYSKTYDTPPSGAGFFIQNHPICLTTLGDWRFSGGVIYMYFGSDSPANHIIKISTVNTLVDISSKNYVTLDGLTIEGGNNINVDLYGGSYVTIQNCLIKFGGNYGIYCNGSSHTLINSNTIDNNNNDGVFVASSPYYTITNNIITNSGMILGMGVTGWTTNEGICCSGGNGLVSYNRIINCGYDGIRWADSPTEISYNFIDYTCMNAADGAGIYSYRGSGAGRVVKYNIVLNTSAQPYGYSYQDWTSGNGIYLDGDGGVSILNNILAFNQGKGLFINSNQATTAQYNTCYANSRQITVRSEPLNGSLDGRARNHDVRYNTLVAQTASQYCMDFDDAMDISDIPLAGTVDYNYYARPISITNYIEYWYSDSQHFTDLAGCRSLFKYDTHSTVSPVALTDVNKIRFEYNDTKINKVVALDAGYIDAVGTKYSGSITLLPFTAVVLMVDPNSSAIPSSPVYVSSLIANATPSLLEMTYNLTLANIVPATTSFSVLVNGVARTVSAVTISGTKVQLTLASRIVSSDIVTVSYIKPAGNPLQTTSGVPALSITNQPVRNSCINAAPTALITSPSINSSFTSMADIKITADASDADGSVSLVEFYNGSTKLGSNSVAPYSLTWNNVPAGNYFLTVIATDNQNVKTTSSAIPISVINNNRSPNKHPIIRIFNPHKGITYDNLSTIEIDADASDPDGTISKVEFYSGEIKLVELTSAPYTYTWKDVASGSYTITAIATDNSNDTTISSPVEFVVGTPVKYDANSDIINLYPNPNDGHFSIEFINPLQNEKSQIIITDLAGKQVFNGPVAKEEILKQFDLSYAKSGIYVMMIKDKEILVTKKFIKN